MSNYYPSIPDPQNNTESVAESVRALKMAVETMSGQRDGGAATRVFTQTDEPKDPKDGDTWISPSDAGRTRLWNGHYWIDVSDSRFSTLEKATANAKAMIKELSEIRVSDTEAYARKLTELEARFNENYANIYDELLVRVTATEALAQRVTDLTAYVNTAQNQALAQVSNEQVARVNADGAIASAITTASVGAARVYAQDTAPVASGRQQGDVWYDTSDNFNPYYWNISSGVGSWVDNSSGTYKIGQIAAISQSISATTTVGGVQSYKYQLVGTFGNQSINGTNYSGIILSGAQQMDPTTGQPGTPITNLILKAGTITLDGNVIVTGTVTNGKLGDNSVSNSAYAEGNSGNASTTINLRAGARLSLYGTYGGGQSVISTNLSVSVNGGIVRSQAVRGFVDSVALGYNGAYFLTANTSTAPTSVLGVYIAPSDGNYTVSVSCGAGGFVQILANELSK